MSVSETQPSSASNEPNTPIPSITVPKNIRSKASPVYGPEPNQDRHAWHIKNFLDYYDFIDEYRSFTMSSDPFYLTNREDYSFLMKLTISWKSISVSLHSAQSMKLSGLACQLVLLNSKKVTLEGKKIRIDCRKVINSDRKNLLKITISSTLPFWQRKDLFPNKSLTVSCEIKFLDCKVETQQIYIPKECQLLQNDYKALLESSSDSDVIFKVDDKEFNAHELILKTRSPVIAAMFEHDMNERRTNRVTITDISAETFKLLLHFIYTDEIETELDVDTGVKLLYAASKYHLVGLQNLCETRLFQLMTSSNYKDIREVAETFNLTDFKKSIDGLMKSLTSPSLSLGKKPKKRKIEK